MKRLMFFLISSGIIFPLVLMVAGIITIDTQANPLKQDSCEAACACQNHDISKLNKEYEDLSKPPYCCDDDGDFISFPSLCLEQWYRWQKYYASGSSVSDSQMNAMYERFLSEKQSECDACQGTSNVVEETETPEPSILLQPVEPVQKPPITATPTPSPTPELPFPEILVEIEKMNTGAPYIGVVADGKSYLDIHITNKDAARQVMVSLDISAGSSMREGRLIASDGSDLQKEVIVLAPGTKSTLRYVPPAQLKMTGNSRSWTIGGKNRKISGYITEIPLVFNCQDCQESTSQIVEFYNLQPPVQMVHGYLGNEGTWKNMSEYLIGKNLDAVPGTYDPPPPDSWIQVMTATLGDDIQNILTEYREQGIKIERVDIVCHSMGGLISRWYIDNNLGEGVRKLVMLATPNHGVDDWHRVTRVIASGWSKSHLFAGAQLNADSNFFAELNTYESEMNHLIPSVEYANIIGRASCGRFCPGDAVVPIASAHLNGVVEYIYDGVIHSSALHWIPLPYSMVPWFSKSDIGITDSQPVMEKVLYLLTNPIPRANPDFAWSMVLQEGSGEVYVIGEDKQLIEADNYPLRLKNGSNIRTGYGKAVIILYLNGEEKKRIDLSAFSDIVFGVTSPDTLTTILSQGFAKFTTTHTSAGEMKNSQFDITLGVDGNPPEIQKHAYLRDLETEFVLTAGNQASVIVLEGSVLVDTFDADDAPAAVGQIIHADPKKAVYLDAAGNLQETELAGDRWWKDEFFGKKYPVPDFIAAERRDPSNLNVSESTSTIASKNDSVLAEPGLYLLGAGLCLGVLILVIFVVIIFLRKRSPAAGSPVLHKGGLMGVSGWLLAVGIAGLAFACLASIAGILWWQDVLKIPFGNTNPEQQSAQQSAPQIFIAQPVIEPPPAPVPITVPLPGAPVSTESLPNPQPMANNLSADGPWIVYSTEDGLWAVNEDGSGLTHLIGDAILSPADLQAAISPDGAMVAFITASDPDSPRDPVLFIVSLPDINQHGFIDLTIPENAPMPNAMVCDPGLEAARAATIGNGLAWSPDGSKLAFSAALEGSTADVYLYSFDEDSIQRLTDEPGQAYDLHWSAEENKIVYFSANCFGTGGGFDMEGVYAVDPDTGGQTLLYRPDEQSYGEKFVDWLFTDRTKFMAATVSGCPFRDMRLVDINTGEVSPIYDGCFEDYAIGPTSMLAVLTSRDMSDKPGVYIYTEPEYGFEPEYFANQNGRQIEFMPGIMQFLIQNHEEGYQEIVSIDLGSEVDRYIQRGEFPAISMDGEHWVWEDQSEFYLGGVDMETPRSLIKQPALYPIWSEILIDELYRQQVLFSGSTPPYALYRLVPGGTLETVGEGMKPIAPPVKVFP